MLEKQDSDNRGFIIKVGQLPVLQDSRQNDAVQVVNDRRLRSRIPFARQLGRWASVALSGMEKEKGGKT